MPETTLSVIIPVYNEEATLSTLLDRVAAVELPVARELVIVDDGSTDGSAAAMRAWCERHPETSAVVVQRENGGKGAAVRDGIMRATGEVIIIQDADLEYDPNDYGACIAPILAGEARVVYGSRERSRENRRHSSPAFYLGGICVSLWFSVLYGCRVTDEPTCYKTFDAGLIRALGFEGDGFEWEPEVTAKLLRLGIRIVEVPISYSPRRRGEGKKIRAADGFRALWEALRWRFKAVAEERTRLAGVITEGSE